MVVAEKISLAGPTGPLSALLERPGDAARLLVLGHGAGAGMAHPFLCELAERLAVRRIATLRYSFPYMERGGKRPDPPAVLEQTVRAAVAYAANLGLPLWAGGKSMGGRITAQAQAKEALPSVERLVFLGYPLVAAGKVSAARARVLDGVALPMLFIQGTRDALAPMDAIEPIVERLGGRASLHKIEHGDHSFRVLKRAGRSQAQIMEELAQAIAEG